MISHLFCFPPAGSNSSVFSLRTINRVSIANSLMDFCKEHKIELIAINYDGRVGNSKLTETNICEEVKNVIDKYKQVFLSNKYSMVGHSLGCLMIIEFMRQAKITKLPLPHSIILSAGFNPMLSLNDRPCPTFTMNSDDSLIKDYIIKLGVDPQIFNPEIWNNFGPTIKRDLAGISAYKLSDPIDASGVIVNLISLEDDKSCTCEHVSGIANALTNYKEKNEFRLLGQHNVLNDVKNRANWLNKVTELLAKY